MRVVITAPDDTLRRFGNQLGALSSEQAHMALARAVNRVTNTVHGRVIRAIRKQSDIPTAIIRRQIGKRLVDPKARSSNTLEGVIWARGSPISLKHFRARQFSYGVKARVWGREQRFPGAFMGPRPGVIAPKLRGHVFTRTSSKRLPIEMLFGPSVPEELVKGESARVFEQTVSAMLPARVSHEIARLLPR